MYGPDVHIRIVARATGELPEADSQWSHRLLAEQLTDDGISASQIGRILADLDLKPHRVRGCCSPGPPELLHQGHRRVTVPAPARRSIVVCIDEKTAIGAQPQIPEHRLGLAVLLAASSNTSATAPSRSSPR